jgi:hypothetical protein
MDLIAKLNVQKTELPGHYVFLPPPNGFNPLRASDEELARCGLPHRPDPKKFPHAARKWIMVMRKLRRFVIPKLKMTNKINGPFNPQAGDTQCGLLVDNGGPFSQIWGIWDVPAAVPPPPPNFTSPVGFSIWAGIQSNEIDNLVQAGTTTNLAQPFTDDGFLPNSAWYEWYPVAAVYLSNFNLSPGDTFSVNLQSTVKTSLSFGGINVPLSPPISGCTFSFANLTSGDYTSLFVEAPNQLQFPSDQAEWVLERQNFNLPDSTQVIYGLPQFGDATLSFGGAVGGDGQEVIVGDNDQGTLVPMLNELGTVAQCTADETPELVWMYDPN